MKLKASMIGNLSKLKVAKPKSHIFTAGKTGLYRFNCEEPIVLEHISVDDGGKLSIAVSKKSKNVKPAETQKIVDLED
jgi:hypothetical protein